MWPEFLLARLAPKTQAIVRMASGAHSLSPMEVAACLAGKSRAAPQGLSRGAYLYALKKWAGDDSVIPELEKIAISLVRAAAKAENWRVRSPNGQRQAPGADKAQRLALVALHEALGNCLCEHCLGRGTLLIGGVVEDCLSCHGTGRSVASNSHRARLLGMDESSFRSRWESRYRSALIAFIGWENTCGLHVSERAELVSHHAEENQ